MSARWGRSRWRSSSLAAWVAVVAACGVGAVPTTTTTTTSSTTTTTAPTTTTTPAATTSTTAAPTTTTSTLPPLPPLPDVLAAQFDELIAITEELRGLAFIEPPMIEVATPEEVVDRRRIALNEDLDPDDLVSEGAFYEMFGILDPGTDLHAFYTDFYSSSTLAYYDLELSRLVVPLTGETLDEFEMWIVVHELTHALMDQHFPEVADRYELAGDDSDFDEIGALLGLLEGEAVLIQSLYLDGLSAQRRAEVVRIGNERSSSDFGAAPYFFRELLRFPYTVGSQLTLDLYRRGGVEALDQAFGRPPSSTEQLIHPDRYVTLEPELDVEEIDIGLDGYEVVESGSWGERGWRILLDHHLGSAASVAAAEGWGGDHYQIAWDGEHVIFAVAYIGDSFADASELASALTSFVDAAMDVDDSEVVDTAITWSGDAYAYMVRHGDQILFVASDDPAAGAAFVDGR